MKTSQTDHSAMRLGKTEPMHDPRTLMLADYLDGAALPATPDSYMYAKDIGSKKWGMMENDKVGDCTCAAAGHLIMEWTDDNGKMYTPPDADIIATYSAVTGYNQKTGKNDNGARETDVLNYWRKTGVSGHKIFAYAALEPNNHNHVKLSTFCSEAATSALHYLYRLNRSVPGRYRRAEQKVMERPDHGAAMPFA